VATLIGEQPSLLLQFGSTRFFLFFVCLFNFGWTEVTEQPAVMLEQTSKNRSAVLGDLCAE